MIRHVTFACLLILGPVVAYADKDHADHPGEVDDKHGNVAWKSTVQSGKETWEYYYEAKNRDLQRNCRVNWVVPKQNWLIPPKETCHSRSTLTGKPIEKEGEFLYNGGTAAGEGVTKTTAWIDHDPKATSTTTSATIFVEMERLTYAIDLKARSSVREDTIDYLLTLEPAKKTESPRYELGLEKLLATCRIQWVSIQSAAWAREGTVKFIAGKYAESAILTLDKGTSNKDRPSLLTFEAQVSIKGLREPVIKRDVVRFFAGEDDANKTILCEVAVPAIVVKERE